MEINAFQIIIIFLIACISGMGSVLDEFQTHRPLIACTLIGLVLGDLKTGIIIGGTLEMMALGWMNIGAAMAPDAALASIISTIIVIAAAGQVLTILCRTITVFFQHQADKCAQNGNLTGIDMCHLGALGIQALRVSIPAVIVASFVGTDIVQNMLAAIPEWVTRGLQVGGGVVVVVGYAMVINMMEAKHLMPFFFLGFVVAAISQLNLVALGIVGVVSAVIYIQLNPKFNTNRTAVEMASSSIADDELD